MTATISKVCFTYAITDGMWIEWSDGSRNWESTGQIVRAVGKAEADQLFKIAYANGMTGMWYAVS